jgi:hypothetical protein
MSEEQPLVIVTQREVLGRAFLIFLDAQLMNVIGCLTKPEVAQFQERREAAASRGTWAWVGEYRQGAPPLPKAQRIGAPGSAGIGFDRALAVMTIPT